MFSNKPPYGFVLTLHHSHKLYATNNNLWNISAEQQVLEPIQFALRIYEVSRKHDEIVHEIVMELNEN